ncbi:hypothetical protein JTE90_002252 [Oedothorax gibbosus]|uniref:Uncharacterized protein n=1 Tax=Oedothorax gibbosus TaxID=931172 RepID=A0AAV6V5S9_9ARAC|nr:hypothetical protein JTE90_002252 [Oedothorax gibbosus]
MMLSHPVLLGLLWSLLILSLSGQHRVSSQETNQVYSYSYHFQHNGTTNSRDILRTVLGVDPDFGIDPPSGQSIVKTFSSPNIRGFFTKGILPAGPIHSYSSGFGNRFNTNSAIDNIKKVVEANLQPPPNIANGLIPPISPDISNRLSENFNNQNGINLPKHNNFPEIPPPPPPFQNRENFPNPPRIPPINLNDFPKIPDPIVNNNGVSRVENFSRNTPDGGKIEGKIETFSYNSPPASSNYQENSQGFRRNENFVNNNQEVTGHRSQSYFKQHFRTINPNIESNSLIQNNQNKRIDNINARNGNNNNNNNQWWNVLNVLGGNNKNKNNNEVRSNEDLGRQVERNINEVKNNLNTQLNRQFGSRISGFNNRQNVRNNPNEIREPIQNFNGPNNPNFNLNRNSAFRNQQNYNVPINNRIDSNNHQNNNVFPKQPVINNALNNPNNHVTNNRGNFNNNLNNNIRINHNSNSFVNQNNLNNNFKNDDTTKKVMNIINDVNAQLNSYDNTAHTGGRINNNNNFRLTWDDDIPIQSLFNNNDWSRRQSPGRPFSNAHSGPLVNQPVVNNNQPVEMSKSAIDSLVGGNREFPVPEIGNYNRHIGNNFASPEIGNYRNVGGGGVEKFFKMDRVVEGPNSFSRDQRRGFERNFQVDSNSGYQRNNQWTTNNLRRLDAQSSKDAFSKDFIDVFRDDY